MKTQINRPKVIFIGTTEFGIPALEMLKRDYDLQLVITQPDKPFGRKKIPTPPITKIWAIGNNVNFLQPEKIAQAEQAIKEIAPDVMIVAAYGQIIPKHTLEMPKHGSINLHSSLLPKYRGASPIQAAILNDDKETGVTIMQMDEKMDHGGIIAQSKIAIDESDDYFKLHQKLAELAAQLLQDSLPKWLDGTLQAIEQDHSQATFVKMINRDDARLDWTHPARKILQQIKALNPEPGTWTTLDKKSVKIIEAEEVRAGKIELPGKIYAEGRDCLVKCGDYSLKLLQVQPEGKNQISGKDFLNGLKNLETKVFV
jgi:methionyl-tRNA formyltransferase